MFFSRKVNIYREIYYTYIDKKGVNTKINDFGYSFYKYRSKRPRVIFNDFLRDVYAAFTFDLYIRASVHFSHFTCSLRTPTATTKRTEVSLDASIFDLYAVCFPRD